MFAIIKAAGKQYKVSAGSIISTNKLNHEIGENIDFNEVLMLGEQPNNCIIGTPLVKNAVVKGKILNHTKSEKIIVFKKKRRQNYRRKKGHKQDLTYVQITDLKMNA